MNTSKSDKIKMSFKLHYIHILEKTVSSQLNSHARGVELNLLFPSNVCLSKKEETKRKRGARKVDGRSHEIKRGAFHCNCSEIKIT